MPLRERNVLLLAAGYAPRYSQRGLDDPEMAQVRASIQRMLDAHDPYPGVVIDRQWNVVLANRAAMALTAGLPGQVLGPPLNVFRVSLHPEGLAARTLNFEEWAGYLLSQLRRTAVLTGDPAIEALEREVRAYPNVAALEARRGSAGWTEAPILVPFTMAIGDATLSLFTTLTTFGTPQDVTLDELAIELFFPADGATEAALRRGDDTRTG